MTGCETCGSGTSLYAPAGVTLRPGDKLLIAFSVGVPVEELKRFRAMMEDTFPDVVIACVDNVGGLARYRPEE